MTTWQCMLIVGFFKLRTSKGWWIATDFCILGIKKLWFGVKNAQVLIKLAGPTLVVNFDVAIFNHTRRLYFYNGCLKPLSDRVPDIQSVEHLEGHASSPLLLESLSFIWYLNVKPLVILRSPPSEMYFDACSLFLIQTWVLIILTETISPLHHLLTESKQSTCSPMLNSTAIDCLSLDSSLCTLLWALC